MYRKSFLHAFVMLIAVSAPLTVGAQGVEGTWKLSYVVVGAVEQTYAIVKMTTGGGKTTGELIDGRPAGIKLKSVTQSGNDLRVLLQSGAVEIAFEAVVPKEATRRLLGTMTIDGSLFPSSLSITDEMKIDAKSASRAIDCPPMQQARKLSTSATLLRIRAQQTKDPDQKNDLLKQAVEADLAFKKESPKLYREVLAKHPDSPATFEAALSLMRSAQSSQAKLDDVQGWATTASKAAKAYGPRWQAEFATQTASALLGQEGFAPLAVDYARQAERSLTPTTAAAEQVRVLSLLARALRKTGNDAEAKTFDVRATKFDEVLDQEYLAKMPPLKGEAFAGRKSKSERAVFMELFTGAMCPPCVAADLAFDVLQSTYKPSELVLVQYHVHIPGPDPLTNPDTEARWEYYGKDVRGVPASLFNGAPKAGGGGPIANAQKKHEAYREVIEPLVEEQASVKLTAKAQRDGDKIDIFVKVSGLGDPGSDKKLRILLTEETVRFAGSNKIRFHHNVVRAFPGGVAGKSLTEAASKHSASIDLGGLRRQLTKYLDDYQANIRPFFNPARPLDFNHLRVIAIVQDDSTREILQAVQVEVK
jgi:hypothetical protein